MILGSQIGLHPSAGVLVRQFAWFSLQETSNVVFFQPRDVRFLRLVVCGVSGLRALSRFSSVVVTALVAMPKIPYLSTLKPKIRYLGFHQSQLAQANGRFLDLLESKESNPARNSPFTPHNNQPARRKD